MYFYVNYAWCKIVFHVSHTLMYEVCKFFKKLKIKKNDSLKHLNHIFTHGLKTYVFSSCCAALTHNLTSLLLPLSDTDTQYEGMKGVTWLSKMASLLQTWDTHTVPHTWACAHHPRGLRNRYVHKLLVNREIALYDAMWSSLIGLAYVTESAFAMGPVHLVTGPIAHSYRRTEPCCLYNYVRQGCLQQCNMHPPFQTSHCNIIHCTFWYTYRK